MSGMARQTHCQGPSEDQHSYYEYEAAEEEEEDKGNEKGEEAAVVEDKRT